ncbi:MAG: SGNH/GDSL hydrolase family protein [Pseudomonadota bacterium]
MISRRGVLAGAGLVALGAVGASVPVLRLHATPRRLPHLTQAHLAALLAQDIASPRVLFVGNSMVVRNDLPARVAARAARDGVALLVASASANGAHLVESLRIAALRRVLAKGWDAIVVQDFTATPLRARTRWGSRLAIDAIAQLAAPAPLLMYPPFPGAPGHRVYEDAAASSRGPRDPDAYAARTMAHYAATGQRVAPVPLRWLEARPDWPTLYDADGHHPSAAGSDLIADVLWADLKEMLSGARPDLN